MILKCPSNCEHDYDFPHSVVTRIRLASVGRDYIQVIYAFIVCRSCDHWISRDIKCDCLFGCHEYDGGLMIARLPLGSV